MNGAFSDSEIMAFVDGEADAALHERLQAALAHDAALAARVQAQRALRARLVRAFAPELDEPVPERLRSLLPPPRSVAPARALPRWGGWALAASLLAGVGLGWWARTPGEAAPWQLGPEGLTARGALASALERQPGQAGGTLRIPVTVRDAAGRPCRAFVLEASAGLACRGDTGRWAITLLAASPAPPAGGLRPAASPLPAAVLQAVDAVAAGPSLGPDEETAAIARGWAR